MSCNVFKDSNQINQINQTLSKEQQISNGKSIVQQMVAGKDPQNVFYEECRKRGVNPNVVLGLAKMVSGIR